LYYYGYTGTNTECSAFFWYKRVGSYLLLHGSMSQADVRFSEATRGVQCTSIAAASLCYASVNPAAHWSSLDVDKCIQLGDKHYREIFSDVVKRRPKIAVKRSDGTEYTNRKAVDRNPFMDASEVSGKLNVVNKIVRVEVEGEGFVNPSGLFNRAWQQVSGAAPAHYYSIADALERSFAVSPFAIIIGGGLHSGLSCAVVRYSSGKVLLVDSHARDETGRRATGEGGKAFACVLSSASPHIALAEWLEQSTMNPDFGRKDQPAIRNWNDYGNYTLSVAPMRVFVSGTRIAERSK
jgi:hypothetical protein